MGSVVANEKSGETSKNTKLDVTWITSSESGIIDGFETNFEVPEPSTNNKDGIDLENEDESSNKGSIYSFLKTTVGETLQFENITKFVADNSITRPKMACNARGTNSHGRDRSSRENNRPKASNRSNRRRSGSETDDGSGSDRNHSRRRLRHRRYRTRKSSHASNKDKKERQEKMHEEKA